MRLRRLVINNAVACACERPIRARAVRTREAGTALASAVPARLGRCEVRAGCGAWRGGTQSPSLLREDGRRKHWNGRASRARSSAQRAPRPEQAGALNVFAVDPPATTDKRALRPEQAGALDAVTALTTIYKPTVASSTTLTTSLPATVYKRPQQAAPSEAFTADQAATTDKRTLRPEQVGASETGTGASNDL